MLCRQSHFHDEINEINHIKNTHTQNTKHVCGVQRTLAISINARKIKNISYKLCFLFLFFYIFPFFFFFLFTSSIFLIGNSFFYLFFFFFGKKEQFSNSNTTPHYIRCFELHHPKKRDRNKYWIWLLFFFFFWGIIFRCIWTSQRLISLVRIELREAGVLILEHIFF